MADATRCPILIAAFGNAMAGVDAFGPMVIEALGSDLPADAEGVNFGMCPLEMVDQLPGRSALYVVDAALMPGGRLGEVVLADWFDPARPALLAEGAVSTHGLSVGSAIDLARALGQLPERVRLVALIAGAEPPDDPPTGWLQRRAEAAADVIHREVVSEVQEARHARVVYCQGATHVGWRASAARRGGAVGPRSGRAPAGD